MKSSFQKVLSALLSAVLVLSFFLSPLTVRAESVSEESSSASSEETGGESTSPSETSSAPTEPAETAQPAAGTEPAETASDTETAPVTEPAETVPAASAADAQTAATEEPTASSELPPELDWNLYFGQLHAHSDLSDGLGSVTDAFQYARQVENLDFFALTDHSDAFDNADSGVMTQNGAAVSREWAEGKSAAAAVTDDSFVGIFGYEMSWQEGRHLGHLNTFGTPGFASRDQEPFVHALEAYYEALPENSVSQFNHPGPQYGDFENFGHYSSAADARICLLEAGGEEGFLFCDAFTRALDAGWHVAPTTGQNNHSGSWGDRPDRTVVLARELTEEALYDAMKHRRVYASSDKDLTVYYTLNGSVMGSIMGDVSHPEICVYLRDPTDDRIGQVDVIVDGGRVAASQWVDSEEQTLTLRPQGGWSYYYLRITQPDGDMALTAPVWTESFTDMGIAALRADTRTPAGGSQVRLSVDLYNNENTDCHIEKLEWSADGRAISALELTDVLGPRAYTSYTLPYTQPEPGTTDIQVKVTASAAGEQRIWQENLSLQLIPDALISDILADGSHGTTLALEHFTALAAKAHMEVTVFEDQMPEGGEILLIPAPAVPFSKGFLHRAAAFAEAGGTLLICGEADSPDGAVSGAAELNKLLEALGSTMRLHRDALRADTTAVWNRESAWCEDFTSAQVSAHLSGCTLDPGRGTWLVGASGSDPEERQVVLAVENTPWGGKIFAAGFPFLSDEAMPLPDSPWAAASVGQRIFEKLLDIEQPRLPLGTIGEVRKSEPGQVCRVRGYVTAGTANPHTRFPETLYLQDDTGGIAVVPFRAEGIQVGTPLEVVGRLDTDRGMPILEWIDYDLPHESRFRYVPKTVRSQIAMDYEENGGRLMQVEGTVTAITLTDDETGIARLTIRDFLGEDAEVLIEPWIRAGSTGKNTLAKDIKPGRVVRAMGIVHLDESGKPVLRVRNCEEVVYVPPRRYPSDNPKTADFTGIFSTAFCLSLLVFSVIWKRRSKE